MRLQTEKPEREMKEKWHQKGAFVKKPHKTIPRAFFALLLNNATGYEDNGKIDPSWKPFQD